MEPQARHFPDGEKGMADDSDVSTPKDEQPEQVPRPSLARIPTYLQPPLSMRQRLEHFTFAWYTLTMSTAGIALCLGNTPHRFTGLDTIGLVVFIFDLVCFATITACMLLRFALFKGAFVRAFTWPKETLFVPTFFLTVASLLSNAELYGTIFLTGKAREQLITFTKVTFWMYLAASFLMSIISYQLLFTVKEQRRLTVSSMTPGWILPIFPVMLAGTVAAFDAPKQPPAQALAMIVAGVAAQGIGFLISVFLYATYFSRLMVYGLPKHRQAMFIAVGPPSFTCAALVAMANDVPRIFAANLPALDGLLLSTDGGNSAAVLAAGVRLTAVYSAVFLWGLSFWFFASAVSATVTGLGQPDRGFHLSWWSFVFPNVGFCVSTIRIGQTFENEGMLWFATVLTVLLVAAWLLVGFKSAVAVVRRQIMWPGHDEDA